jgi:hypothetical protein
LPVGFSFLSLWHLTSIAGGATRHSTSQNRAFAFKIQWDYQATLLSAGNSRACAQEKLIREVVIR